MHMEIGVLDMKRADEAGKTKSAVARRTPTILMEKAMSRLIVDNKISLERTIDIPDIAAMSASTIHASKGRQKKNKSPKMNTPTRDRKITSIICNVNMSPIKNCIMLRLLFGCR